MMPYRSRPNSWQRYFATGLLMGIFVLVGGCSGSGVPTNSPEPESAETAGPVVTALEVDCAASVDSVDDLSDSPEYEEILGSVALPVTMSDLQLHEAVAQADDTSLEYFAKMGLLIRGDSPITVKVDHPPEQALITWASNGASPGVSELSVPSCEGDQWKVFAGGIQVREPMCVTLIVSKGVEHESVDIAVDAPCKVY